MNNTDRDWSPDPTGRHPYRSVKDGNWTDLVAAGPNGEAMSTDAAGGRLARMPAAPPKAKRDPLATAIAAFSVIPFGAAALFLVAGVVGLARGGLGLDAFAAVLVAWILICVFVGLLVLALARGVRNSARRA